MLGALELWPVVTRAFVDMVHKDLPAVHHFAFPSRGQRRALPVWGVVRELGRSHGATGRVLRVRLRGVRLRGVQLRGGTARPRELPEGLGLR